jgi:competence transcription factor ComK
MEHYIKDVSDITYMSELTQHIFVNNDVIITNMCWVKFAHQLMFTIVP